MNFAATFSTITGNAPFPWQTDLYEKWFSQGRFPKSCSLPTGLGKTSIIAIWLIALANDNRGVVPRRLVYVVNRRTVVDQTTVEAKNIQERAASVGLPVPKISTLRGQFADNREWSADPSQPAIVVGTVDMIGSRLLFSGYGVGFKAKPLHAGFLGQDALVVHDEAHLEPAFQKLLEELEAEQQRCNEFQKFHVVALTATTRGKESGVQASFGLTVSDFENKDVKQRVTATKKLRLHELKGPLDQDLADLALAHRASNETIVIFVRSVAHVSKIYDRFIKAKVSSANIETLTGTRRGKERDEMVGESKAFARFLPDPPSDAVTGTTYLICTSAGEVGVNISATHLVCDLSTYESMAQRFGRVNRFGAKGDSHVDVVYDSELPSEEDVEEEKAKEKQKATVFIDGARRRTLELLRKLKGDASPQSLDRLSQDERIAAFTPEPERPCATDIHFDAWALTTIRHDLPGRPPVAEFLHGKEDDEQFETHFAWREEVDLLTRKVDDRQLEDLLDEYPLRPHELLRVATYGKGRAYEQLDAIAARVPESYTWVVELDGSLRSWRLKELVASDEKKTRKVRLAGRTVVLPPQAGGFSDGYLQGVLPNAEGTNYDVAGLPPSGAEPLLRFKIVAADEFFACIPVEKTRGVELGAPVKLESLADVRRLPRLLRDAGLPEIKLAFRLGVSLDEEPPPGHLCDYIILKPIVKKSESFLPRIWPSLTSHLAGVRAHAEQICSRLNLDPRIVDAVVLAAAWHDLGKGRSVWQRGAGNSPDASPVAKTLHGRAPDNLNHFRHELGSMADICTLEICRAEFLKLDSEPQDLVLHLIATHHGRGRPHFPVEEIFDQAHRESTTAAIAAEAPHRFARLQRRFGRWGLAYLESLLRAADALHSQELDKAPLGEKESGAWPKSTAPDWQPTPSDLLPTIRINTDLTNPGHYFASCGLLELAERRWPGAMGWFDGNQFCIAADGDLVALVQSLCGAKLVQIDEKNNTSSPVEIGSPFRPLRLDWWQDELAGGKDLKVWAGTMESARIAKAMQNAMRLDDRFLQPDLLNVGVIAYDPDDPAKKVEPYYFDARRGPNAHSRDVGFSPNDLQMTTTAYPAVELLCLIGLQRCLPTPVPGKNRVFDYYTWGVPAPSCLLPAIVSGQLRLAGAHRYRFENWYRTGQKKHKAFRSAILIPHTGDE